MRPGFALLCSTPDEGWVRPVAPLVYDPCAEMNHPVTDTSVFQVMPVIPRNIRISTKSVSAVQSQDMHAHSTSKSSGNLA
jgi:hypothetical protein